jgi:hypothetical protein
MKTSNCSRDMRMRFSQKNSQLKQKEKQIQTLNKQLKQQEDVTAEIYKTNNSLQRPVEQLQQQQSVQIIKPSQPPPPRAQQAFRGRQLQQDQPVCEKKSQSLMQPAGAGIQLQKLHPPTRHLTELQWRDGGKAPCKMTRGAAVVDKNVAYFMSWNGHTCSYDSSKQRWSELPWCPHSYGSLGIVRSLLTVIGGRKLGTPDNKLLSMNSKPQMWVELFLPMPSKRFQTAVVSTKQHLIVAGGESDQSIQLVTVEVMDIQTLVWSTVASLPHPYSWASAAICGDQLYMLGGFDKDSPSKSVLTCSLTKLLQSYSEASPGSVWHKIADAPVYDSICASVNGELLAVGGRDKKNKTAVTASAIHKYNPTTNAWDIISNMPTARHACLVAVLPTNEMMVVGGYLDSLSSTDKIETAGIIFNLVSQ